MDCLAFAGHFVHSLSVEMQMRSVTFLLSVQYFKCSVRVTIIFHKLCGISGWKTFLQISYLRSMPKNEMLITKVLACKPLFSIVPLLLLKSTTQTQGHLADWSAPLRVYFSLIRIVKVNLLLSTQGIWGGKEAQRCKSHSISQLRDSVLVRGEALSGEV